MTPTEFLGVARERARDAAIEDERAKAAAREAAHRDAAKYLREIWKVELPEDVAVTEGTVRFMFHDYVFRVNLIDTQHGSRPTLGLWFRGNWTRVPDLASLGRFLIEIDSERPRDDT